MPHHDTQPATPTLYAQLPQRDQMLIDYQLKNLRTRYDNMSPDQKLTVPSYEELLHQQQEKFATILVEDGHAAKHLRDAFHLDKCHRPASSGPAQR